MKDSIQELRDWCTACGVRLHERVLGNGNHHVWLYQVYRFDCEHRDLAFACRMLLARLQQAFPLSFKGAPKGFDLGRNECDCESCPACRPNP